MSQHTWCFSSPGSPFKMFLGIVSPRLATLVTQPAIQQVCIDIYPFQIFTVQTSAQLHLSKSTRINGFRKVWLSLGLPFESVPMSYDSTYAISALCNGAEKLVSIHWLRHERPGKVHGEAGNRSVEMLFHFPIHEKNSNKFHSFIQ